MQGQRRAGRRSERQLQDVQRVQRQLRPATLMSIRRPFSASQLGAAIVALLAGALACRAPGEPPAVVRHVAAAQAAAGTQWDGLFSRLCAAPAAVAAPAAAAAPATTAPSATAAP